MEKRKPSIKHALSLVVAAAALGGSSSMAEERPKQKQYKLMPVMGLPTRQKSKGSSNSWKNHCRKISAIGGPKRKKKLRYQ